VSRASWLALVLAFAGLQVFAHERAGFTFPPPWIDEAQFLWQAKAVADSGTLLAPELHPARAILWMPPGYMITMGALFRLLGFDFALARACSLCFVLAAFVLLARLLRPLPHGALALVLAGAYFAGRSFVATANVARMEALLLLLALAGFELLRMRRAWLGLSLLAATPLVHPNGVWFFAAGAAFALLDARTAGALPRWRAADAPAVLLLAAAWLAFGAFAAAHAPDFAHDLGYQLARKAHAGELARSIARLPALAALLVVAHRLRDLREARLLAALGVAGLCADGIGQEYWYEVFASLFFLVLCVLALEAALRWLERRPAGVRRPRLGRAGVLAALLLASAAARRVPDPLGFPGNLVWHRMRFAEAGDEPYLTAADRAFVRDFLVGLAPPGERPRVRFHPAAEALFYADLERGEIRVSEPLFHDETPDWHVLRTSRWHASGSLERARFARAGIAPGDAAHEIRRRGEERWYAVRSAREQRVGELPDTVR
jgi:hypothetical protein